MAAQLGHLSDGRQYMIQRHDGDGWRDLAPASGTPLCDNLTTWLLTNGAGRIRAIPNKAKN